MRSLDGTSVSDAVLDIWQAPANGMYENTDPSQAEFNCRGRLRAASDGNYRFWTVKPVPYPIPKDGPAGLILDAAQRHNMRAAHIHVIVEAPGYEKVISELFVAGDPYIDSDAVFGVKDSLTIEFVRHESAVTRRNMDGRFHFIRSTMTSFWCLARPGTTSIFRLGAHEEMR